MFGSGALAFKEFELREPLPLATIHERVLEFLRGREDAVLFGAQAVNAYVNEPRMTQDIDIMSTRARELADELREHISSHFHIAVRIREIGQGRGFRLFQVQKTGNRHLVDIRPVDKLPESRKIADIQVLSPVDLIASKVISYYARRGNPKAGTDWRDIAMLLLEFPELKSDSGAVTEKLIRLDANPAVESLWKELVATDIHPADESDEF